METKSKYKMTEVGEIPIDWEVNKLKNIGKFSSGTGFPEKYQGGKDSKDIPFFKVSDMNLKGNEVNMIVSNNYVNSQDIAEIKAKVIDKKSIIFAKVGAAIFLERKRKVNSPFLIDNNMMAFSSDKSIDFNYLYYLFSRIRLSKYAQVGALPSYNASDIGNIKVAYPESSLEQQKIAEILSTVDEQIEETDQLIEKTKELKKGLMQQLLTKGIGHTEFKQTELGEIPVEWEVSSFFDNIEKTFDYRGRTPKKIGMEWGNGVIPALSANNVKNGYIDFEAECYLASDDLYNKWMTNGDLRKGDVLFTMEAPLGNVTLVPDNNKYILSQRVVAFRTEDNLYEPYFMHYIDSELFRKKLNNYSTGTTAKGISQKNLSKLKVIVPPIEEQQKIAEILSSVDENIKRYEEEKAKYDELKNGLMQQLLTGKTRVKVD